MRFDLTSSTDAASHAIFDPGSLGHRFAAPQDSFDGDALAAETAAGNILELYTAADGTEEFAVFVDEEPAAPFPGGYEKRGGPGILRVPGGRLMARGVEEVHPGDKPQVVFAPGEARVPPGDYRVEVLEFCGDVWAEARAALGSLTFLQRACLTGGRAVTGFGCLLTLVAIVSTVVVLSKGGAAALPYAGVASIVLAAAWLAAAALSFSPPARSARRRLAEAAREAQRRTPVNVVLLRRLRPGEEAGLRGVRAELA